VKRQDLKKLALLGITGGVLLSGQSFAESNQKLNLSRIPRGNVWEDNTNEYYDVEDFQYNTDKDLKFLEDESSDTSLKESEVKEWDNKSFWRALKPQTQWIYENLNEEGQAIALALANQSLKDQNSSDSCGIEESDCTAGDLYKELGPIKDIDEAVRVAQNHMEQKIFKLNEIKAKRIRGRLEN